MWKRERKTERRKTEVSAYTYIYIDVYQHEAIHIHFPLFCVRVQEANATFGSAPQLLCYASNEFSVTYVFHALNNIKKHIPNEYVYENTMSPIERPLIPSTTHTNSHCVRNSHGLCFVVTLVQRQCWPSAWRMLLGTIRRITQFSSNKRGQVDTISIYIPGLLMNEWHPAS